MTYSTYQCYCHLQDSQVHVHGKRKNSIPLKLENVHLDEKIMSSI
jgi:hypothetical protein